MRIKQTPATASSAIKQTRGSRISPDCIGFGGEVDIGALTARLRAGDRGLDPRDARLYARYRLPLAYLLAREGWPIDRLLTEKPPPAEVERRLRAAR